MHISENPTFFQMWGDFRHWLAARQLFEEKRPLTPLAPCPAGHRPSGASVELGTDEPPRQWSLHRKPRPLTPQAAMGGDLGIALSMRGQDPPSSQGLSPSLLTFCPSASLPAISIPVVYLHLDGPVRQRAHGGMDLTQHLRSLRMGPPAWPSHAPGPKGDGGTPTWL